MSYKEIIKAKKHETILSRPDRFVEISQREDRSDIDEAGWAVLYGSNSYITTWKGILSNQGIAERTMYEMLLHELQPGTIIELGALNGGTVVWFADILSVFGVKTEIYSVDIDLSLIDERAKSDQRIHFIEGDCTQIEKVLSPKLLESLPHPWLVIDDTHADTAGICEYFHNNGLQSGDYLIMEDTNPFVWSPWTEEEQRESKAEWFSPDEVERGNNKLADLRNWLKSRPQEYLVDTHYLDLFGYNVTKHWNSILKKVV
ncbi:MAG: cephalosporin hydroxylase [Okeania sp. SIO3B5]|uniref:CmcI family methyltransferase n=1 Tax=Okeania sp. SIO3B5 TaxID=2607811 RepID=UPI0014011063|nr:CmcI family methyltransferase [Okeania sp. SIO3B5]NEO53107.1 cephalosporin hydroxylase [Okeania sp. SIO3B5]